jgi:PAS domain S-box-containing protein
MPTGRPWKDPLADLPLSEMTSLTREHAWEKTPVGPIEKWPPSLLNTVRTVLACRLPMYVAWGKDFTQFYNDAYRPILGNKHPTLGWSTPDVWPEIWDTIGPMWQEVLRGKPIGFDDFKLTINRYGYEEDCWFNFSYSPVYDDQGAANGVLVTFAETTEKIRTAETLKLHRERLQLALDAASMGWWHYDPASDRARWDDRFARIFGVDGTEGDNATTLERVLPEDRPAVQAAAEQSLDNAKRAPFRAEYRIRHPAEGVKWIEARGIAAFRDGESNAESFVGTVRDVTEIKLAQDALHESETRAKASAERLSLALETAQLGDWSWDAATDVVTLAPRAADIFGIPPGAHITWTRMRELLHEDDRGRAAAAVVAALERHEDYDIEYRVMVDGATRWVLARGRGVYAKDGAPTHMIGLVQDVSERKRLENALRSRTSTLEALLETTGMISAELDIAKVVQKVTDTATQLTRAQFGLSSTTCSMSVARRTCCTRCRAWTAPISSTFRCLGPRRSSARRFAARESSGSPTSTRTRATESTIPTTACRRGTCPS